MGQWGKPRHKGVAHNRRVRGSGTWTDQDRRLKWHMQLRHWRNRGVNRTWSGQARHRERRPGWQFERLVTWIILAGLAAVALNAGGYVLLAAVVLALAVHGWRKIRG